MVMGDTQLTPFDMGTFGSRTTPTMNLQLRKVAAAARDVLIGSGGQPSGRPIASSLVAADGKVTDPDDQTIPRIRRAGEGTAACANAFRRKILSSLRQVGR